MEPKNRLSAKQLRELSDEVESLRKYQDEARITEIFIPMTRQQHADFEARQARISHICVILSEHSFKR